MNAPGRLAANYGKGFVDLSKSDSSIDQRALVERLRKKLGAPGFQLPTLPTTALEVVELSRQPDVDLDAIIKLLERDTLFAGRVLKVSQSAAYAGVMPAKTLRDAAVRLGLSMLRQVVLEAAFTLRVFRAPGYADTCEQLRRHSTVVAHFARLCARHTAIDAEFAFLAGLVHDVGIAACLIALGDVPQGVERPYLNARVWGAVDAVHEEVTGLVAAQWKLPGDLLFVVQEHHTLAHQGYAHPVRAVLMLAERLAQDVGQGMAPVLSTPEFVPSHREIAVEDAAVLEAMEALRLSPGQFASIRTEALAFYQHLKPTL